ncbi:MAG: ABC transporter ATP-binding protein [[Ruminococcus] faecis]|nr:ABC transporter ATP-binding protein [Mediterraneibacter faecis]
MKNLFKYAASYWKAMIAIVLILVVQAYCDLSLPAYTSDIVNVGIQQGGIEDEVPRWIATEEMEKLLLFVSEDDQQTVLDAYTEDNTSYKKEAYVLKDSVAEDEDTMGDLKDILQIPMMMTSGIESGSDTTKQMEDKLKEQMSQGMAQSMPQGADQTMPEGMPQGESQVESQAVSLDDMSMFDLLKMLPAEQRATMVEKIEEQMSEMPDTILDQAAVSFCRSAYKDLGMDMDQTQIHYLLKTGGQMAALALLGMAASITVAFLASRVGASAGRDLRSGVFHKVVGFSNNEFNHFSTASLITRSTNDIQQIQMLIVMLLRMVLYAPILAIGGVLQVMKTNVSMSWIIGLAVIIIAFVVLLLFLVVMPKFKVLQNLVDKLNLVTREILTGLPVIRAFSTEKHEEERFDDANRTLTKTNLFVNRAMTFMMPVMMLVMNGVSVLIVWTGAHGISDGQMQVGDMMAFIQYTMQIIMGFLMLCMISIMLPRAAVAADRVEEVLKSETMIHDPKQEKHFPEDGKGVLTFDHVSFRYPGADEDVLEDITFTAKPGETTAIIGSTGSGKSTLVNLIPRFYDVTSGDITLDGVDIREVKQHELRERLGYVPQKGVLFSGDIASNIMFGNSHGSDDEMIEAAEIAQATEFIDTKPEKYKSPISQGGSNVSGGQKQRLSIARAIAKHPQVFIFDDSFSALDYKTDVTLRRALAEKTSGSTVLIVAQRISTILHAEQIIVLDEGKVAGKGTHAELLKNCPVYREIAESQLSRKELEAALNEQTDGKEDQIHG